MGAGQPCSVRSQSPWSNGRSSSRRLCPNRGSRPAAQSWEKSRGGDPKIIECPKIAPFRAPDLHPIDDSPKGRDMTPIEFREKKTREIQELLEKLSSLDGTSFSSENKDRLFHTYQRQIERLTVIVSSPSLERLCSG
jgi:hypothetical protein